MPQLFVGLLWVAIPSLVRVQSSRKMLPDYGLVLGNPGKLSGFMSRHGHKLHFDENNQAICPESKYRYEKVRGMGIKCLDLDEDSFKGTSFGFMSMNFRGNR